MASKCSSNALRHQPQRVMVAALGLLLAITGVGWAATNRVDTTTLVSEPQASWNTNPAHWERMLEQRQASSAIRIGKSDFTLSGPLVDGVRRRSKSARERSLGQRLLGLPVVRLFVPQPIPSPPSGGRYFAWGERDAAWGTFAKASAPLGNTDNPISREVTGSLISVGLR